MNNELQSASLTMEIPMTVDAAKFVADLVSKSENTSIAWATFTKEFDSPLTEEQETELKTLAKQGKLSYHIEETLEPYKCAVTISLRLDA